MYIHTHIDCALRAGGHCARESTRMHAARRVLERRVCTRRHTAEIPDAPGAQIMLDRNYSQVASNAESAVKPHIAV